MAELGWKSVGVLELTALPSIPRTVWLPAVEEADVLLVNGGDTIYLDRWMRESGLAELLPSLDLVYVGLSAGSLVMSPSVADDFASWTRPVGGEGLGVVDFEIFPHLDNPDLPENTMADAERWAAGLTRSGYAIDDQTAIKVVDGVAERDLGGALAAVRVVVDPRIPLTTEESIQDGSPCWRRVRGGLRQGRRRDVVLGMFELTQIRLVERRLLLALAVRLIRTQGLTDRIA